MSANSSPKSSSHSASSGSSSNQKMVMLQKDRDDLTIFGSPAPTRLSRSGTVRRASTSVCSPVKSLLLSNASEDVGKPETIPVAEYPTERFRRSLDSTYRHSLESISEYKTKQSFSTTSLFPSRETSSVDSSSSDCTDHAIRSATENTKDKTFVSASSSYLSWIESVNNEFFGNGNAAAETADVDTKVGEWNNFWLNYNSPSSRYMSSPYLSVSNDERTGEELSDGKSTCSTHRDFTDKQLSSDQVFLTHEEVTESIKCAQRIVEILQNALKRNEHDVDESRNDSYYSQSLHSLFSTFRKDPTPKERVRSYSLEPQELQRQKKLLQSQTQSSNSCINVLLNTGVADILKRVINKRRDAMGLDDSATTRSSFSEWSSAK